MESLFTHKKRDEKYIDVYIEDSEKLKDIFDNIKNILGIKDGLLSIVDEITMEKDLLGKMLAVYLKANEELKENETYIVVVHKAKGSEETDIVVEYLLVDYNIVVNDEEKLKGLSIKESII